jgi:hypothetical protein
VNAIGRGEVKLLAGGWRGRSEQERRGEERRGEERRGEERRGEERSYAYLSGIATALQEDTSP